MLPYLSTDASSGEVGKKTEQMGEGMSIMVVNSLDPALLPSPAHPGLVFSL